MKHRDRGKWTGKIVLILLCASLTAAIIWGMYMAITKLRQYGDHTVITTNNEKEEDDWDDTHLWAESALPRNTYESEGFYEVDGIRTYEFDDVIGIAGIDVSAFQPVIDWEQVKQAGIEFAMIRQGYRGYSTGKLDLDACFLSHMDGALAAGLDVGVYFFSQALTPEEALEEAEYVITWLEGYEINYPVVFDWEEVEGPARTDEMNMLALTACAEAFCKRIEEAGYEAAVYFNQAYGYEQLNLVSLREYDFWLAEYAPTPTFAYDFSIWQYTNEGAVPGIDGPVDLNICFKK